LKDERRHQSARQIEIDGAASGGLLDMKRSPTRVHGGHMRDDHLGCEHGFQLVPRADPMKKRQDEVCGRGVEGFRGISVKGIYELLEKSLGDDLLRLSSRIGSIACPVSVFVSLTPNRHLRRSWLTGVAGVNRRPSPSEARRRNGDSTFVECSLKCR
jgi:hypothetical protein